MLQSEVSDVGMEMNVFVIALALIAAKNGIQHFIVADICGFS